MDVCGSFAARGDFLLQMNDSGVRLGLASLDGGIDLVDVKHCLRLAAPCKECFNTLFYFCLLPPSAFCLLGVVQRPAYLCSLFLLLPLMLMLSSAGGVQAAA